MSTSAKTKANGAPKKDKEEKHATMAESTFCWNSAWIAAQELRDNPVFPLKPTDRVLATLVRLPGDAWAIQLTKLEPKAKK